MEFHSSHASYDSEREQQKYIDQADHQLFKAMSAAQVDKLANEGPSYSIFEFFAITGKSCYGQPGIYTYATMMYACQLLEIDQDDWTLILERDSSVSIKSVVEILYELQCLIEDTPNRKYSYTSDHIEHLISHIHKICTTIYDDEDDDELDSLSDECYYMDETDDYIKIDLLEGLGQVVDQGHESVDSYIRHHSHMIAKLATDDQREIFSYLSKYSDAFDSIAYLQSLIKRK